MTLEEKVRENRLRRMALRQGFKLMKNRRRDPRARDYGIWYLVQIDRNIHAGEFYSLDQIEGWLTDDARPKAAA